MKILKYIMSVLTAFAFLLEANVIRVSYQFLNIAKAQTSVPLSESVYLMILVGIILVPLVYMASYAVSFIFMLKDRITGYLISGIISVIVFADGAQELLRNNASISATIVATSIFWAAMVVLSFWTYLKFKRLEQNLTKGGYSANI